MTKARYIMIGGFLGAGKTTAILRLARYLRERGLRVGLITNDQSVGLVDTAILGSDGFPVEEITGGCFCCKFNSLVDASERLSQITRPDVFIAEPVGSCTDLLATVSYPLRRIYGEHFSIAPLSVMVDPIRAMRIVGVEPGRAFSKKVLYVYSKQLEEAEIIVINKADLIDAEQLGKLDAALAERYLQAGRLVVSARQGTGLESWFERVTGPEMTLEQAPEVDYDLYAEGEALLGWFNCTARLSSEAPFDGNAVLREIAHLIQHRLAARGLEVAHLKMTLNPDEDGSDIGVCNLVHSDGHPEQPHLLREPLSGGELIVNLRAEGDPEELRAAAIGSMAECLSELEGVQFAIEHMEHFRPARPIPTHRLAHL